MKYIKYGALVIIGGLILIVYIWCPRTTNPLTYHENVIDLYTVKVGDKIADMTVTSVGPLRSDYSELTDNNLRIEFVGKTTITGTFYLIDSFTTAYCFTDLDVKSWTRIPVLNTDAVNTEFCFIDFENAKKYFEGREEGRATVIIDEYIRNRFPSEVYNTAELVNVMSIDFNRIPFCPKSQNRGDEQQC